MFAIVDPGGRIALRRFVKRALRPLSLARAAVLTRQRLRRNRTSPCRRLEIGPGLQRIEGFETLDITPGPSVDYVADATRRLPFADDAFAVVHASHVLEHLAWYRVEPALREWVRILAPGGRLEIWVPDGLKICSALVAAEYGYPREVIADNWWIQNPHKDPAVWASGRLFNYDNDCGLATDPHWHHALFTERYLHGMLQRLGLETRALVWEEVRSIDHGWSSLGVVGVKPQHREPS